MATFITPRDAPERTDAVVARRSIRSAERQGYELLHVAFVIVPVIAGLDKFAHLLANWDAYLAPAFSARLGGATHGFMLVVGVVEIIAGLVVAARPRVGGYVVAAWLAAIIINLLASGQSYDIALRDLGLLLGALALARLAVVHDRPRVRARTVEAV
jgi:hypothetical protein